MNTNKKFKNSVFTMLFSDPDLLRELYCALEGVCLPQDVPVTINTLENALFMGQINDVSFEIGGKLVVLVEHQSTINVNMALRLLMYAGRVYEKIIEGRNIYSSRRVPIPKPEFFVLYNGTDPFPDNEIYRLSDSFESLKELGREEKDPPSLELFVKVININEGRNGAIASRCKKLAEYSAFVAKARVFVKELGSREEAVKEAVKYCRKHGILREFLKLHASEVLGMLFTEWNLDDAIAVRYEEGLEDGFEKGRAEGHAGGLEEGRVEGVIEGKLEIARNLLAKGMTPEFVHDITGLDLETIAALALAPVLAALL
jgi:predicted transposase/invertase (TIGR01784 family)